LRIKDGETTSSNVELEKPTYDRPIMIGKIRGIVEERDAETCLVDVAGVGYELTCSVPTLDEAALGQKAVFHVYTHVREDQIALFGFSNKLEKELFLSLLSVNGVGPKMAIKILSSTSMGELARAIESGDVKALSQLPKVGKKTAEQLVITLKGKVAPYLERGFSVSNAYTSGGRVSVGGAMPLEGQASILHEISSALLNLGFRAPEIERVMTALETREATVSSTAQALTLEEGVRFALQTLGGMR
jgi:Holliday junction DNA helicase RuvA